MEVSIDSRHLRIVVDIIEPMGTRHFDCEVSEPLEVDIEQIKGLCESAGLSFEIERLYED